MQGNVSKTELGRLETDLARLLLELKAVKAELKAVSAAAAEQRAADKAALATLRREMGAAEAAAEARRLADLEEERRLGEEAMQAAVGRVLEKLESSRRQVRVSTRVQGQLPSWPFEYQHAESPGFGCVQVVELEEAIAIVSRQTGYYSRQLAVTARQHGECGQ